MGTLQPVSPLDQNVRKQTAASDEKGRQRQSPRIALLEAAAPLRFDKIPPDGNIPSMNKVLKKVWAEVARGIGRAMVMSHDRPYVLPAEKSFPIDAANLRGDARRIAHSLNQQFKK